MRADVAVVVRPLAATPAVLACIHAGNPAARVTMVWPTRELAHSTAVSREAAIGAHLHVRIDDATAIASISDLLHSLKGELDPNDAEAQTRRARQN